MAGTEVSACECGKEIRPQSVRCRKCAGAARRGPREKGNGYLRVFAPGHPVAGRDGYALAHRLALHDAGIEIPAGWHVHHRNGDKRDNRVENLEVRSPEDHSQFHADEAEVFINQFGTFKRVSEQTPEEREGRRQKKLAYLRAYSRRAPVGQRKEGRQ